MGKKHKAKEGGISTRNIFALESLLRPRNRNGPRMSW